MAFLENPWKSKSHWKFPVTLPWLLMNAEFSVFHYETSFDSIRIYMHMRVVVWWGPVELMYWWQRSVNKVPGLGNAFFCPICSIIFIINICLDLHWMVSMHLYIVYERYFYALIFWQVHVEKMKWTAKEEEAMLSLGLWTVDRWKKWIIIYYLCHIPKEEVKMAGWGVDRG